MRKCRYIDTYEVRIEPYQTKLKHNVIGVFVFAGVFFVLRFGWSVLSPTPSERSRGLGSTAIEIALVSLVWAMVMVFWTPVRQKLRLNFELLVDADSMTAVYPSWIKRSSRRMVRKGKVRSIFEIKAAPFRPGGIGISERREFAARMLGFVYVPKTLPEFDKLKSLAEGWRVPERAD